MLKPTNRMNLNRSNIKIKPVKYNYQNKNINRNSKAVVIKPQIKISNHRHNLNNVLNNLPKNITKISINDNDTIKVSNLKNSGVGKSLVIIACGPSILESDIEKLNNIPNIDLLTINKHDMRVWPTKYWLFFDQSQYKRNKDLIDKFPGIIIIGGSVRFKNDNIIRLKSISGKGFSKNLSKGVHIGRSSTYVAMQVGYWMNYDKIYILGCDMCRVKIGDQDLLHYYGTNPDVSENIRLSRFEKEAEFYDLAIKILGNDKDKYYMCSNYNPWPFMEKYNRINHKNIVDYILENSNG